MSTSSSETQCCHNVVRVGGYIYTAFRMFREWMRCGAGWLLQFRRGSREKVPFKCPSLPCRSYYHCSLHLSSNIQIYNSSVPLCHASPITIASSIYPPTTHFDHFLPLCGSCFLFPTCHLLPLLVHCCTLSLCYLDAETEYRVVTSGETLL